MGRYYNGDIEGKFMFAVQSSDAADRFGVTGHTGFLQYYFEQEHIPEIKEELVKLQKSYDKVSEFFKDKESYNKKDLIKSGVSEQELSDYADYRLGKQILTCLEKEGQCYFDAEI